MDIYKIGARTAITGLIGITSLSLKKIAGLTLIGFTIAISDEIGIPTFGLSLVNIGGSLIYHKVVDGAINKSAIITIIQGSIGYSIGTLIGNLLSEYFSFVSSDENTQTATLTSFFTKKLGLKIGPVRIVKSKDKKNKKKKQ